MEVWFVIAHDDENVDHSTVHISAEVAEAWRSHLAKCLDVMHVTVFSRTVNENMPSDPSDHFNDNRVALRPPERESQMRYAFPDARGFAQERAGEWSDPKPRSCPTCQSIGTPRVVSHIGEPFRLCGNSWHTS